MMLKDIASYDKRIHRMHTLSDIPKIKKQGKTNVNNLLFAGDIAYSKSNDNGTSIRKGLSNKAKIGQLKGSITELDSLRSLFPKIQVLKALEVTPENLKAQMKNTNILHISTHGTLDESMIKRLNYENAFHGILGNSVLKSCQLYLSGYNDDSSNNINALDIQSMNLSNIELVYLDACETAAGKDISGRVFSMAEAFRNAGVQNIIANLDPIPDDVATEFALNFYQNIKDGMSFHDAFYTAKTSYVVNNYDINSNNAVNIFSDLRIILWE